MKMKISEDLIRRLIRESLVNVTASNQYLHEGESVFGIGFLKDIMRKIFGDSPPADGEEITEAYIELLDTLRECLKESFDQAQKNTRVAVARALGVDNPIIVLRPDGTETLGKGTPETGDNYDPVFFRSSVEDAKKYYIESEQIFSDPKGWGKKFFESGELAGEGIPASLRDEIIKIVSDHVRASIDNAHFIRFSRSESAYGAFEKGTHVIKVFLDKPDTIVHEISHLKDATLEQAYICVMGTLDSGRDVIERLKRVISDLNPVDTVFIDRFLSLAKKGYVASLAKRDRVTDEISALIEFIGSTFDYTDLESFETLQVVATIAGAQDTKIDIKNLYKDPDFIRVFRIPEEDVKYIMSRAPGMSDNDHVYVYLNILQKALLQMRNDGTKFNAAGVPISDLTRKEMNINDLSEKIKQMPEIDHRGVMYVLLAAMSDPRGSIPREMYSAVESVAAVEQQQSRHSRAV